MKFFQNYLCKMTCLAMLCSRYHLKKPKINTDSLKVIRTKIIVSLTLTSIKIQLV